MVAVAVAVLDVAVKVHADHFVNGDGGNVKFCGH